jgi:hypothetical protein
MEANTGPGAIPTLDDLALDPSRAAGLSPDLARALWVRGHVALGALAAFVTTPVAPPTSLTIHEVDRYLTMQEVKERTGLSLSFLYEMARTGVLPVKPMGKGIAGTRRRGYRVLLSELLAWEARLGTSDVDGKLSNMLSSRRDGRRVSTAPKTPRADTGPTGGSARRAPHNGLSMGTRPDKSDSATRRQTDSNAGADTRP